MEKRQSGDILSQAPGVTHELHAFGCAMV